LRSRRKIEPESEFSDAELAVFGEFAEAERDGKHPDIEEYLKRIPESADKMRPSLEAVVAVGVAIKQLKDAYPNVDLAELLDPGRRWKKK
jgi:uncharacterized Fe-S cluster-containing protein